MWSMMKNDVDQLARSLASYTDLLLDKKVRMEAIHSSTEPVRQISQNLTVMYTKSWVLTPAFLGLISESLKSLGPNVSLELGKLLPTDRRRHYEHLDKSFKAGSTYLCHICINTGNLHWMWHCT